MNAAHINNRSPAFLNKRKSNQFSSSNNLHHNFNTVKKYIVVKKPVYEDSNPYSLVNQRQISTPVLNKNQSGQQSVASNRDNRTENSSQKSVKVVRANGLKKAQKPNLMSSRISNKLQTSNVSELGGKQSPRSINSPARKQHNNIFHHQPNQLIKRLNNSNSLHQLNGNHLTTNHNNTVQHSNSISIQNESKIDQSTHQQNKRLRQQNKKLKEELRAMETRHIQQTSTLNQQINKLFDITAQLQLKMQQDDDAWRQCIQRQRQFNG